MSGNIEDIIRRLKYRLVLAESYDDYARMAILNVAPLWLRNLKRRGKIFL